ncbi:pirin family protein [Lysinibacter sp. HNR]|uniref:pirin family protein n=1 Tax=Lysinibacter sp. HNR TaxID=3031408 RepID=UPI00243498BC|nr:pirin family protein [Lysinibacter sp. HNR]WGD37672.1 pirin family protein [Lysinibacter sp. HNR]
MSNSELNVTIIEARDVPLGGVRALNVRRTLPHRNRTTVGAWCFIDHYGPDNTESGGMLVPPHPHTGLQTVSWLFDGEIEHRDSVGSHQYVKPGELNLMTAGYGISHSEVSTTKTQWLHGVQLWTVLPEASRNVSPHFEHHVARHTTIDGADVLVFVGELAGASTDAITYSPLLGAEIRIPAHTSITIPTSRSFEHGILVDSGDVWLNGTHIPRYALGVVEPGLIDIRVATGDTPARIIFLGGEPLGESIVMWWNFIGRSHEDIVNMREQWHRDVVDAGSAASPYSRFGVVAGYPGSVLPAPATPIARLKPR